MRIVKSLLVRLLLGVCACNSFNVLAAAQQTAPQRVDVEIPTAIGPAASPASLSNGGQILLLANLQTLRRVVLAPEDVGEAALKITLQNPPPSGTISLYRPKHLLSDTGIRRADFESKPLATLSLNSLVANSSLGQGTETAEITGLADMMRKALRTSAAGLPFLVSAQGMPLGQKINLNMANTLLDVKVTSYPKATLFVPPISPRPGVYVRNRQGHLYYGDQRLRLWGCVRPQLPNVETADRIANMGFNAIRMWGPRTTDTSGPLFDDKTGQFLPVRPGDGSQLDEYDRFFARAKADGLFVMVTGLMDIAQVSETSEWLKGDGQNWEAWRRAMAAKPDAWIINFMAAVDSRLYRARQQQMKDYLTHRNPYTGNDYAHEEAIAIYELANENAHVKRTLEKGFDKWPPFFVSELREEWNRWLIARYHDDATLSRVWGKLEPGESLRSATIELEPVALHKDAYSKQRASDFIRFLIELDSGVNKWLEDYARSFAPSGVGVAVIPFSYDTQYQPSNAWLFDDTRKADVANFGMYFWSLQNPLTKPPSMYVMDSSTVEDKITVIYETMDGRPDPYRGAYPYRLAALASWEDWDAIFFHYWEGFLKKNHTYPDEQYMAGTLSYIAPTHYWTSVYYDKDPVLLSSMAIAGQMFLRGAIAPAAHPLTYVLGSHSIFDFSGLGGEALAQATYTQGARIRFDPNSNSGTTVEGRRHEPQDTAPAEAIHMGGQVLWDWPNGRLIIDTPTAKAYVGVPHGRYRFKDGTVVGGFDGKFVSFGMTSVDGKPLTGPSGTKKVYIAAVDHARNTGYRIRYNEATDPPPAGGPLGIGKLIESNGTSPTVVDRVPYQIWFPTDLQGHFDGYDLARRKRLTQNFKSGHVEHDGRELYVAVLSIDHGGSRSITTPLGDIIASPSLTSSVPISSPSKHSALNINKQGLAEIWNPLSNVKWSDTIMTVEQHLRSADNSPNATIVGNDRLHLADTRALFQSSADIDIIYQSGQMESINATFTQPPAITNVVMEYDKLLGAAIEKHIAASEDQITTVKWVKKESGVTLEVVLTETQGTLGIVYTIVL